MKQTNKNTVRIIALVLTLILSMSTVSCKFIPFKEITQDDVDGKPASQSSSSEDGEETGGEKETSVPEDTRFAYAERVPAEAESHTAAWVYEKYADTVVEIHIETSAGVSSGAGSGVIISENGCLVTCHHVIDSTGKITVHTTDGTEYEATVIGSDTWSDLALLKINAADALPYATFAVPKENSSEYLKVGEGVVAIGNPLGYLGGTLTVGAVSSLDREIVVEGIPMTLIQTDAAVSPGNSGGALFNLYGELVGIVNAKSTASGVDDIGFAIPSTLALKVVNELAEKGYVSGTPYLGMSFSASSSYLTIVSYDFNAELKALNPSLADGFEIKSGDILGAVDGKEVRSFDALKTALAYKKVGDTAVLTVYRITGQSYFGSRYDTYEVTVKIHEYTKK